MAWGIQWDGYPVQYSYGGEFYSLDHIACSNQNFFLITIEPQPVLITELASRACEYNLSITDPPSFPNQIFG